MKLSTAILKGSNGLRQGRHYLFNKEDKSYCVLGAACFAVGIKLRPYQATSLELRRVFPELLRPEKCYNLEAAITTKNDRQNWSFKRIAMWLKKKGY